MKKLIIAIILGTVLMACEQEQVGYLFSSEAAYPIDSLVVLNAGTLQQTIDGMKEAKDNFEQTEEGKVLYGKIGMFEERADSLQGEETKVRDQRDELTWYIEDYEDVLPEATLDSLWDLVSELDALRKEIRNQKWDVQDVVDELKKDVEAAIGSIEQDLAVLQRLKDNHATYSTSVIEGIKGTEPLIYSIAEIKVIGQGDAGKFAPYLSVMGGGRIVVDWDDKIPPGRYLLSLYVENEGWKYVLKDKYTIIVK